MASPIASRGAGPTRVSTAYSTYAIALAAVAVEDGSGLSLEDFLARHLFEPCQMASARFMRRPGDEEGEATPYEIEDGAARRIGHEWYVTAPASSLVATAADVARFMIAHHAEGHGLRFQVKQALFDALYPDPEPRTAPAPNAESVASLREYAGRYLSSLACHT